MAEGLSRTYPDANNQGPAWDAAWFACHQSAPGDEVACRGWLAQMRHAHPLVRLTVLRGELPPEVLAKLKANTASLPATASSADSGQAATPAAVQAGPGASQD